MRLLELEIHNVRGICDMTLHPSGKNLVIWGQNGSGKSAIVDSIDFLLTGHISRLMGKGTGDIKLDKHGTHIKHEPKEATVRAVVAIPNYPKPIEIKRCIEHPGNIEYVDDDAKQFLGPILSIANRGQHILTRREILKYITAEPNNRAQEIQTILDLKEIEDIRKSLTSVDTSCKRDSEATANTVKIAEGEINAVINEKSFNPDAILQFINTKRKALSAGPIAKLDSHIVKAKITAPAFLSKEKTVNTLQLQQDVDALTKFQTEESKKEFLENDKELRTDIEYINSNPHLMKSLQRLRLIELGIQLLDDSGSCPLCDTQWKPGELIQYLERQSSAAKTALIYQKNVNAKSKILSDILSSTLARVKNVVKSAEIMGLEDEKTMLESWSKFMEEFIEVLSSPIEKYSPKKYPLEKLIKEFYPTNCQALLASMFQTAKSHYPRTTPELDTWDTLTTLASKMDSYEKAVKANNQSSLVYKRSSMLLHSYTSARDNVLKSLYDSVRDRFVELYRFIHGTDESNFTAEIKPDEAALDFNVSFYNYGEHPPHALHSEGHQDSMGICLYLSLTEKLTQGNIDLIILDDVIMSVDMEHRKQICNLFSKYFPNNQFLITTHDRSWANHLRSANIVDSQGMVQFYNWHVDTGPQVDFEADIWNRIDDDLKKDDVTSASGKLRNNAEQFFALVCDSLRAPVVYNINGSYDLGDLLDGAVGRYRRLIKKAKDTAQSWGKQEESDTLQEFDDIAQSIYTRTNAERWMINPTIHYNNWSNLSKPEFEQVIDAFRDLYGVFVCSKCHGILHLVISGGRQEAVRCNCTQINWNLVPK